MTENQIDKELLNSFVVFDIHQKPYWKEWNFYADLPLFIEVANRLLEKLADHLADADCVVALSKSGIPIASWVATKARKPLYVFSIGEIFHPSGATIIGLYPEGDIPRRNKAVVVDSHVNTAGTYQLFTKVCRDIFFKRVFGVLIDVRNDHSCKIDDTVISLYGRSQVVPVLKEITRDEEVPDKIEFWMREETYWLTDLANEMDSASAINPVKFQKNRPLGCNIS